MWKSAVKPEGAAGDCKRQGDEATRARGCRFVTRTEVGAVDPRFLRREWESFSQNKFGAVNE